MQGIPATSAQVVCSVLPNLMAFKCSSVTGVLQLALKYSFVGRQNWPYPQNKYIVIQLS